MIFWFSLPYYFSKKHTLDYLFYATHFVKIFFYHFFIILLNHLSLLLTMYFIISVTTIQIYTNFYIYIYIYFFFLFFTGQIYIYKYEWFLELMCKIYESSTLLDIHKANYLIQLCPYTLFLSNLFDYLIFLCLL